MTKKRNHRDQQDAFVGKINEVLDDFDFIEDYYVDDTDDPEVVELTIRGRLKSNIGRTKKGAKKQQQDPVSDYDRAMKGLSYVHNSTTRVHRT